MDLALNRPAPTSLAARKVIAGEKNYLAFVLGAVVFAASPPEGSADFLRIPFAGSYLITFFDFAVGLGFIAFCWTGKLKFDKREAKIYQALGFVILTRAISLLFATSMAREQVISVLRYVSTFVILILLTNLLASRPNRRLFLKGIVLGAVIETAGGLLMFFSSKGENRGIWLGLDNYELQVFLLVACCLGFPRKNGRAVKIVGALFFFLGITVTETRRALILFLVALIFLLMTRRRQILKPVLAFVILGLLVIVPVLRSFSSGQDAISGRLEELWNGGGTIGYRIVLWEMALAAYLNNPVTGLGSGGFARQQNALYFQANTEFTPEYEKAYGSLSTHNTVLGVAAETGTLGLIAYLFWAAAVATVALKAIKIESSRPDPYVLAACACLLAMLFEDWWGQASFIAPCTCLIGFLLGWFREQRGTVGRPATIVPAS